MNEILNELTQMFSDNPISMIGSVILGIGTIFAIFASISYQFRAFTNKKAWEGNTRGLSAIALITFTIGAILFAFGIYI